LTLTRQVTAVIGDLASLFGCVIGLPDSITAITIVALGTSLPDTFASRTAAVSDPTADAAVGNVTGSNAVNVFLGLGLPWLIGALYWASKGQTAEWAAKYPHLVDAYPQVPIVLNPRTLRHHLRHHHHHLPHLHHLHRHLQGGFAVPAGDLVFSVSLFCGCALVCLSVLALRRVVLGCELGGPPRSKVATGLLFTALWAVYIALSCWEAIQAILASR
jgi:solute carrier family 8 (sodium/calcium exchanger)